MTGERRQSLASFDADAYRAFVGGSMFAARDFVSLWSLQGGRPVVWSVQLDGAPAAILPGVEFGAGPLTRFMSLADGCYGGVFVAPGREAQAPALVARLVGAVRAHGYARALLFDYDGHLGSPQGFRALALATTLVDISGGDWEPPDRKLLSQVRKAEREGITVRPFDWDRDQGEFLALVGSTAARQGRRPTYGAGFYEALAALARVDPRVHWVWCEHDGHGACSHIYLRERGNLQGWQIHYDKAYSFLKPNQYIRVTVCREMAAQGVTSLNLGGTPENAPGLRSYKQRWGGTVVGYRALECRSALGRAAVRLRRPQFGG